MNLNGKNVVITGASQGIGEKMADAFAAKGANVVVVARSEGKLAVVAERINGHGVVADLTKADDLDGLVATCIAKLGHIDVWVNNAGIETSDAFAATPRSDIRTLARLNFEAPLLLTHDAINHMLERGSGHVVQMSSVAAAIPFPGLTAYAGTKAGLTNFTESLRLELADSPIGLTVVSPGPVDTAMWDRLDTGEGYNAGALKRFRQMQFLPKLDPTKLAAVVIGAVENNKRHVRVPARFSMYHQLNNAPRRMVEAALTGVKFAVPSPGQQGSVSTGAAAASSPADFEPIWATDNPPSQSWPLYTRGNVGEVFPEVVLPMTWDLYGQRAENGWRAAYADMGLLMPDDMASSEPMTILSVFGGYCYINASYVRVLGVRAPGGTVEAIDMQFFGESDAPDYQSKPGDKNLRSTARLGKTVFRLLGTSELPALLDDKAKAKAYVDAYPGDGASDDELVTYITDLAPLFEQLFERHINNTFSVALLSGAVVDLLTKAGKADKLVSLLGGIGDVESAAPAAAMWKLARDAAANPVVNAEFDAGASGLIARLTTADQREWVADFSGFLEEFGSRGPNEWDLGSDPWDFRPEVALAAISRMRTADTSHAPAVQSRRLAEERLAAISDVRAALNRADRFQFDKALNATTVYSQGRERSKTTIILAIHGARRAQAELASRIAERGGPQERWKTCLLSLDEFRQALADPTPFASAIEERAELHAKLSGLIPPFIVNGTVPALETWDERGAETAQVAVGDVIEGIAGCPGIARGIARVVLDPADPRELGPGDVLIAPITDPSWTPLFLAADAVVVDVGATMSHAVIVARELGIPCVVSAVGATTSIPDGATLEIDGNAGTVTVLALPSDG